MQKDETGCEDLLLTSQDVVLWRLDESRLCHAIAWAFECIPIKMSRYLLRSYRVGSYNDTSVLLMLPENRDEFQREVTYLAADWERRFILFTPTDQFVDRRCRELLSKVNSEVFDLASHVTLTADGNLEARIPARELFTRFLPRTVAQASELGKPVEKNAFAKSGSMWKVVFGGRPEFHIEDTLGARYVGYLLHHPNEPIPCFKLEVAIMPEKGLARDEDSIQKRLAGDAVRKCLRELEILRSKRDEAAEGHDQAEVNHLNDEIETITKELNRRGQSVDTGERARGNVRKAIDAVRKKLMKLGKHERAFAEHIAERVSLGYKCNYNSPEGAVWQ